MGGGFPIAFRGAPSGALNPNDFGQVGMSCSSLHTDEGGACKVTSQHAVHGCQMCNLHVGL